MSQNKNTDNTKTNSNSDEIARSIIQPIVDQAAGDSKGGGTHSKPPLPHNGNNKKKESKSSSSSSDKKKSSSSDKSASNHQPVSNQFQRSSSNRNIVFHPDHPDKAFELSSTSTVGTNASPNRTPDPAMESSTDKKKNASSSSLVSIPKRSSHNKIDDLTESDQKTNGSSSNDVNNKSSNIGSSKDAKKKSDGKTNSKNDKSDGSKLNKIDENKSASNGKGGSKSSSSSTSTSNSNGSSKGENKSSASTALSREARRERRRKLEDPNCFPKRFEVQVQARVRVEKDLSSQHLTDLPEGSVVTVEEISDRRARISRPLCGWLSVTSKFGARIILPTNSKYSKIGGKVMFKQPIRGQQLPNGTTPQYNHAKVVDYNEENNSYKVRMDDNTSQWIDIEAQNVTFISQHKAVKVQKPLDGTAPTFTLQTSQAFFNQFFCKDYPQYQAQSSSTTRHMDISPVAVHPQAGSRFGRYPSHHPTHPTGHPPHGHPVPGPHGHPQGHYPPAGHGHPGHGHPPHGQYPPDGPRPPHMQAHHPGHPSHASRGGRPPYPPPGPHGHPPYPPQGHPQHLPPHQAPPGPYPPQGHPPHSRHPTHPYPPNGQQQHDPRYPPNQQPPTVPPTNGGHKNQLTSPPQRERRDGNDSTTDKNAAKNAGSEATKSGKASEEFVNKVKEIERRIIQHLHQRGYDESHPDYHRYLQKAKELAIQKAGKEREKMLAQQRESARMQQKGITRSEYEQYVKYRNEQQQKHEIAEKERRRRLDEKRRAIEEAERRKAAASGQRVSKPSVKGLIVLRGLPGSGKTTLAKKLAQRSKNARICTEDRYHWSGKED
eukprot:CAMPEP_0201591948 /NCGR_PEP_ID=MMETSP0190_2-20130828/189975_1 /ASSEMBLY_ACC=CAM_ASM_000263 /TAXON_ID=37353 /ORGANISM="Rosalina sp." /LENGTH=825 /DNA_ID=CAMNT_0048050493 /DNA_START=130 /DNA_END=2604 /DNA_ORIENTATION=+